MVAGRLKRFVRRRFVMGSVVREDARVERIDEVLQVSSARATARGGEVAAAATARLGVFLAAIAVVRSASQAAKDALIVAMAQWLVAEDAARVAVGSVFDQMRNALGRPRRHPALEAAFPSGPSTYTEVPRAVKPTMLQLLTTRIGGTSAPPWTDAQRGEWSAQIEAARVPLLASGDAAANAIAAHRMARANYASAVRAGLRALVVLKRELKYLGLTEAQVHEIIPDEATRRAAGGDSGGDAGTLAAAATAPALPAFGTPAAATSPAGS